MASDILPIPIKPETQVAVKTGQISLFKKTNRLAETAPIKIPIANCGPQSNNMAKTKPEAGHIGVAFEE